MNYQAVKDAITEADKNTLLLNTIAFTFLSEDVKNIDLEDYSITYSKN